MTAPAPPTTIAQRERTALLVSVVVSAFIGTVAVVWGAVASADILVFDGVFTLAGIALSAVSLLAAHVATQEPSHRFPFGRPAATPLAVAIQGAALAATLVYGAVDAVSSILDGGSPVSQGTLVGYGVVTAVVAALLTAWLSRYARGSDLAHAEAVGWRSGVVMSVVVAVGGVVGLVLVRGGHHTAAAYVDPLLVLVAVALVTNLPVRLLRSATHELLEGAPPPEVDAQVRSAVDRARERFSLPEPVVRATKVGRRLYVEIDFVVAHHAWDVDAEDEVRRAVVAELDALPLDVWATVELTTDPHLAE